MFLLQILYALWFTLFVIADPAPVSRDSPRGVQYIAKFTKADVTGSVWFISNNGYAFVVANIRGLPRSGGPYDYRIHQRPVPSTGDCRQTFGVLDPYDGKSRAPTLAEFRVGDYSGKYGQIHRVPFLSAYWASYSSLNPQNPAYVGDLSVVITRSDGTRVTCASITRLRDDQQMPQDVKDELDKAIAAQNQQVDGK